MRKVAGDLLEILLSLLVLDIKEDSKEDNRTYLHARLISSTRSTPTLDFTSLIEPEVCLVLTDIDPD
ncbi:uncharacterized protein RAG0_17281 [Rhynchosporium agropyri]|uniref:Uncharacterized protein n=1 Tax=Rhynchosporium agropyri TaxID=914238 RepID=A0A1E1LTK0_9HELO|nr:uncharacterized protein RAG0_17281 [Rhynchosporium agropyri]